ncbi:MAG: apolipoprotein N-acyltransferase [Gammaproteobacteria bacterium]|nr:apolipoprotein N-acyltransferase [Gammaproteobacteria bacterium]
MLRALIAFCSGVAATFAFAPYGQWWLTPVTLAMLFWLWLNATPKQAFLRGWAFAAGLFGFGAIWIHHSMSVFGGMALPLALFLAILLASLMALYYGLAGYIAVRLSTQASLQAKLIASALAFVAMEWLRSWFLSGFSWLTIGFSQIDSPLSGFAPIGGVLLVSLLSALTAALLLLIIKGERRQKITAAIVMASIWATGGLLGGKEWTQASAPPLKVTLLQANIPQDQKWLQEMLEPTLQYYTSETMKHLDSDLILWPESAITALKQQVDEALLKPLSRKLAENNTMLITGILTNPQGEIYYNNLLSLDGNEALYDKRHLVPFGEYFPLGYLWKESFKGLATIGDDFTAGNAAKPLLQVGGYQAGASICYEIIFGEEIREALPEAHFLVNMSNDAWFGKTVGPLQHFEMARMRALENGRYLLRATNTGVTAIIDPHGKVQAQLPQFQRAELSGAFTPYQGSTPYSKHGHLVLWIIWGVLLAWILVSGRKRNQS